MPATPPGEPVRQRDLDGAVDCRRGEPVHVGQHLLRRKGGYLRCERHVACRHPDPAVIGLGDDARPGWVAVAPVQVQTAQTGRAPRYDEGPDDAGDLDNPGHEVWDARRHEGFSASDASRTRLRSQHDEAGHRRIGGGRR